MSQDVKTFQNQEHWEHRGSIIIELMDGFGKTYVPKEARIEGNTINVPNGFVKQVMGGIQFHAYGKDFAWGYKWLKTIRKGNGDLLWVNKYYRDK